VRGGPAAQRNGSLKPTYGTTPQPSTYGAHLVFSGKVVP
jgi:hypothetical protein